MSKALPNIAIPTNNYTLPKSGQKISIRSMTGQEYEMLLVAKENDDKSHHLETIYRLLDAIVTQPPNFDSRELAPVDFDFIFTKMMVSSYGKQTIDFSFLCKHRVEDKNNVMKDCNGQVDVQLNIGDKGDVEFDTGVEDVTNEVFIDDQFKLVLKPVTTEHVLMMTQNVYEMAYGLIDRLVDVESGEEWKFAGTDPDVSEEDGRNFVKTHLEGPVMEKIGYYYRSQGRMTTVKEVKCPKCGYQHKVRLNGFFDFFGHASPVTA